VHLSRRSSRRLGAAGAVLAAASLALTGCSNSSDAGSSDSASGAKQSIKIFAAASLQGPLDTVAKDFTAAHPEYSVDPIVYDGSQALATQAIDGADVDVFAFASEKSLEPVTSAGLTKDVKIFASNTLEIAVAPGNPKKIASLQDLTKSGTSVVVCASEVPCGQATDKVTKAADLTLKPVSEETNVTSVVNRVAQGEADAGLVYATDVKAAGDKLEGVDFDGADDAVNKYPVAVNPKGKSTAGGEAFEQYLLSDEGQKTLTEAGFGKP